MRRSYSQYCGLARALDRIGDRWTLLIVRELLIGPRRYADLRRALPGIASNLLASRLRELESEDIVRRRKVPPPTPATVYELTEHGAELEHAVMALARWGGRWMYTRDDDVFDPTWLVLPMRAFIPTRAPKGMRASWEFEVEGEVLYADLKPGGTETGLGSADDPDLRIACDARTVLGLISGQLSLRDAEAAGATVTGRASARKVFDTILSPTAA